MADTKRYTFLALAPLVAFSLFVFMVLLVSSGDSGDVVKARKIGDVIMPDREIETITSEEVEPPEEPEIAPPDIAPPQLDVTPIAVSATQSKPEINFSQGTGALFRDGDYIPLFKVQPIYPRRAKERNMEGYVIVAFTITESGTIEEPYVIEGMCRSAANREGSFRECTMFDSSAIRAASELVYEPALLYGVPMSIIGYQHKFTFELEITY